jgi:dTMP kinase
MNKFKTFISFEGIDFCGKSTQIDLLLKRLSFIDLKVKVLREPGGTFISEKIRDILLDTSHSEMSPQTEILLYSAARAQLVHQTILEELKKGVYIIADRYFDSTTAYQGYGRNIDVNFVNELNRFATSGLIPFKTFFIDISPGEAEKRRKLLSSLRDSRSKKDRIESESTEFYNKIRQGYLKLAENEPDRIVRINGELSQERIAENIWNILTQFWPLSL